MVKLLYLQGTYDTVRIDRIHDDQNRATSFWLAPSLNYLPVKVSQTADGKVIFMELTKIELRQQTITVIDGLLDAPSINTLIICD